MPKWKATNVVVNCMLCHTISTYDTTSVYYKGQQLKYCKSCELQTMATAIGKKQK